MAASGCSHAHPMSRSTKSTMGGVDKADQLDTTWSGQSRRSFISTSSGSCSTAAPSMLSSFDQQLTVDRQAFKTFRMALAEKLIGDYCSRQRYTLPHVIHDAAIVSPYPSSVGGRTPVGSCLIVRDTFPSKAPVVGVPTAGTSRTTVDTSLPCTAGGVEGHSAS